MEVSKQIIDVLDYISEKIGVTIDWTSQNIIPYVQELCGKYIQWEIASSVVWIILMSLAFFLLVMLWKKRKGCPEEFEIVFILVGGVLSVMIVIVQIFEIVKCVYFPEMQIYEYVKFLMERMR